MRLIIDIPNYPSYNLTEVQNGSIASKMILEAVKNGIPYSVKGEKEEEYQMADKIRKAIKEEFKYQASQGRTQYSMEEVIYIVNEVIDEVEFEENNYGKD